MIVRDREGEGGRQRERQRDRERKGERQREGGRERERGRVGAERVSSRDEALRRDPGAEQQ